MKAHVRSTELDLGTLSLQQIGPFRDKLNSPPKQQKVANAVSDEKIHRPMFHAKFISNFSEENFIAKCNVLALLLKAIKAKNGFQLCCCSYLI